MIMMETEIVVVSIGAASVEPCLHSSISCPDPPALSWGLDHWLCLDL